ncbi:uncharacterized protein F4822DRAFT_411896 [Hypoxylon trugodes]|uniref:uncharacterized protein n=1 Tax=Hypoxylon trugodes TaxID=326681 RepID=UPI00219F0852|nr:uncharacterized protein F4822DRAFT_411896 [Hypoxylon trugodes]KAI1387019.1 hypothetical protein F4822DRAFT_411896 [Hypoxylon trugodes]
MHACLILLRAAPFLASTSYVTYTVAEDLYLRPFGNFRPDLREQANQIIPAYRDRWFPPSLAVIFTLYPLGIGTAITNLVIRKGSLDLTGASGSNQRVAAGLYIAGAVFSALHFAFGPRDLAIVKRIDEKDKDNAKGMADWVSMNRIRGLVADFPSWLCYFAGFMYAMS